ncbi:MAG: type 4a pilus biogenesis protein PilO [Acidobacteriota bacterium]
MSRLSGLSQQGKLIVLCGLVLVLCGLFYLYFIRPLQDQLSQTNTRIESLEVEVAAGEAVRSQLGELKKAVAEQEARLLHLRRVLPEKKETAEIIRKVYEMALGANLKINSFTPRSTVNNGFYEDWPILISLDGNYNSLGDFFGQIGAFTRIINVENIHVKAITENPTRARTLSATCTATTFVFLEPQPTQAVEESE